ncbi:hypothetical protein D3C87_2079040 [compost metagenome]
MIIRADDLVTERLGGPQERIQPFRNVAARAGKPVLNDIARNMSQMPVGVDYLHLFKDLCRRGRHI